VLGKESGEEKGSCGRGGFGEGEKKGGEEKTRGVKEIGEEEGSCVGA